MDQGLIIHYEKGIIMEEWTFRRPVLEDKDLIDTFFRTYPTRSCDRTFANVLLWAKHYHVEFCFTGKVVLFRDNSEGYGFAWPVGPEEEVRKVIPEIETYCEKNGHPFLLYGVTPEQFTLLESWYPGKYQIVYDRDGADYIYESEKLCTLSGKKLHGKRNHINKFKATFQNWSYEKMTDSNLEECFQMALKWRNENGCEEDEEKNSEMCVTLNSLRLFRELELIGGILRVDGKIAAFTIGEPVNEDTFVVHIEKAFADIPGAYTMINQQFVEHECMGYRYVNREDDVGQEGLRKAKLSYKPAFLVEKGIVTKQ